MKPRRAPLPRPRRVARAGDGAEPAHVLALARRVLTTEANAIVGLAARLGADFVAAVDLILHCQGRVVVSGIGKSGHIARKLAATLASTGTPAFFVHPAEASHGDLGMITPEDVVVMLSNSGETDELMLLTPHLKRQGAKIVALTGNEQSSLAQAADVHLDAAVDAEACPWASRRRPARPRRWRWAMPSLSRCSTRAAFRSRTSPARILAASSDAACSPGCATSW